MDPAFLTAVGAVIGVIFQAVQSWRKEKQNQAESDASRHERLDEKLDARLLREFDRMDAEIQALRIDSQALRLRVSILEGLLLKHDIPIPPL